MKRVVAALVLIFLAASNVDPALPPEGTARLAPDIIKRAHRYHGILVSEEDVRGHFFIRDGVRCRLLSDTFLAWFERTGRK
jgi:hypothetical protein